MLYLTQYLLIIVDSCPSINNQIKENNENNGLNTKTKLIRQISKFTSKKNNNKTFITTKNEENNEIVLFFNINIYGCLIVKV